MYKDKTWLEEQYHTNKLSVSEIARLANVSHDTIRWYMHKFGVKMRSIAEASRLAAPKYALQTSAILKSKWAEDKGYRAHMTAKARSQTAKYKTQDFKDKISKIVKHRWKNKEYRMRGEELLNSMRAKSSAAAAALMKLDTNRDKMRTISTTTWDNPEHKTKMLDLFHSNLYITNHKAAMQSDEYRQSSSKLSKARWADPKYRAKMMDIIHSDEYKLKNTAQRAQMPRVSSIQTILYSILDDLKVKYYREYPDGPADPECTIGPYNFDCVIPREGKPTLLIECQGDYWHSTKDAIRRDASKSSYISNNFPSQYELKCIWEHEFSNKDKIIHLLKYWLGLSKADIVKFDFDNLIVRPCPPADYRLLLAKYHYLATAGRGGNAYGAYLDNTLIAVCVFSPLVRQNINIDGYGQQQIRELSRLCIHPNYQQQNLGSWFISRCINLLPANYKLIISYCDTTYNHDGAIYKACNFTQDKTVPPDYWYIGKDGWVMHKKALYSHAIKYHTTEAGYAEIMGYAKVYGYEKLRFVYER